MQFASQIFKFPDRFHETKELRGVLIDRQESHVVCWYWLIMISLEFLMSEACSVKSNLELPKTPLFLDFT